MAATIVHRGPDSDGTFVDDPGVALGFRRLAVVDLTPTGDSQAASAGKLRGAEGSEFDQSDNNLPKRATHTL